MEGIQDFFGDGEGFKQLARIKPCVSVFRSVRTYPDNDYFQLAEEIAFKLTQHGYGVIIGGVVRAL